MSLRKYGLPFSVFIVAIAGIGLYLLQTLPPKEPVMIIKLVEVEKSTATQPPKTQMQTASATDVMETINAPQSVETEDSGHFHDDGTWNAQSHTDGVSDLPIGETWRDSVWYPENYTQADIQADLAGQPAMTDEEYKRRSLKHLVNSYLQRHWEKYPNCTEQELLLADAKDHAKWLAADTSYNKKHSELTNEFEQLMSEYDQFMEKYGDSVLREKKLSSAEARNVEAEAEVLIAKVNDRRERKNALMRGKPIKPNPRHTH